MVRLESELFHAACNIMRTRDAQLAALGDDELMHYGRKGMKWNENIYADDLNKRQSSGQNQYAKQLQAEANKRRYGGSAYNDPKPKRPPIPAASRLPEEPEPITGLEKRFDNSSSAKADYYRNKYGSQSSSSTPDDVENGRRIREQQRARREAAAKYGGPAYTPSQKDLDKLNEDNKRANAEKQIERANAMRRNGINGQSEEQKNLDDATRIAREKGKTVLYEEHGRRSDDNPEYHYAETKMVTPTGTHTTHKTLPEYYDLENPESDTLKGSRIEARHIGDKDTEIDKNSRKRADVKKKADEQIAEARKRQLLGVGGPSRADLDSQKSKAQTANDRANQIRDAREHDRNVLSSDKYSDSGRGSYDTHDISYTSPSGNRITKSIPRESGNYEYQGRQGHMNIMNARGENLEKLLKNIDIWKQKKK